MAGVTRWALPFTAVALIGIFLLLSAGSAYAATITGTVTASNGKPVVDAVVTLYQGGIVVTIPDNPTMTDSKGFYEFTGLLSGDYSVQAEKDAYTSIASTFSINNSDMQVDLQILGYVPTSATPTPVPEYYSGTPTPTPSPTPTPKPSVSNTPVPLPTQQQPGFGLLLALASMMIVIALTRRR